jgi:hypothetical protein
MPFPDYTLREEVFETLACGLRDFLGGFLSLAPITFDLSPVTAFTSLCGFFLLLLCRFQPVD